MAKSVGNGWYNGRTIRCSKIKDWIFQFIAVAELSLTPSFRILDLIKDLGWENKLEGVNNPFEDLKGNPVISSVLQTNIRYREIGMFPKSVSNGSFDLFSHSIPEFDELEKAINGFMNRRQEERRKSERLACLKKRLSVLVDTVAQISLQTLPPNTLAPDVADILMHPVVQKILHEKMATWNRSQARCYYFSGMRPGLFIQRRHRVTACYDGF